MSYYEVIFETGDYAIADYADEAEAISATQAHHEKATAGQPGGPTGRPAERVARLLDHGATHPDDFDPTETMSAEQLTTEAGAAAEATDADAEMVAAHIRGLRSPLAVKEAPHDTAYLMPDATEVALPFLTEGGRG